MLDQLAALHPDGLIRARDAVDAGAWAALRSAVNRGEFVRLWPGVYVPSERTAELHPEALHRLTIAAFHLASSSAASNPFGAVSAKPGAASAGDRFRVPVFADVSAAALWGLPVVGVDLGRIHLAVAQSSGGRSQGRVVRHAWRDALHEPVGVHRATTVVQTVIDVSCRYSFATGLAMADSALRRELVTAEQLAERVRRIGRRPGCTRARRVVRYADPQSASPLESVSRAQMIDLRMAPDDLQHGFVDARGKRYDVDFWWSRERVIGEADGLVKFTDERYLKGRTPAQAAWDEKVREDALRAMGNGFTRWGWHEATDPALLRERLLAAGVRERPRSSTY